MKKVKIKKHLTINNYQKDCIRTETGLDYILDDDGEPDVTERITNGVMGLNGEAGECIDIVKKWVYHKHPLNKEHLAEELGDVAWYLAITADAIGYSLEDILRMNIEKREKRYPNGFESERSINRE